LIQLRGTLAANLIFYLLLLNSASRNLLNLLLNPVIRRFQCAGKVLKEKVTCWKPVYDLPLPCRYLEVWKACVKWHGNESIYQSCCPHIYRLQIIIVRTSAQVLKFAEHEKSRWHFENIS